MSLRLARSVLSPNANGNVAMDFQSFDLSLPTHSKTHTFSKLHNDSMSTTPDELFTKFTVVEVKAFQTRLKADADAKQEELRLMVGERYRDLLQASSAIISISKSSKRVLEAIEDSKEAILSQDDLPLPPKSTTGINDKHLTNLQVLSTHIKLLLDTPEHLWRLIERKNYLHAAWLFLLSRVAHRTLTTHDEDEQSWAEEGLEVETDFPLVQRQWEVVAQFRSQIIHKSTLSLRDTSMSTEDICAALVSLYLLDSRPLNEVLSTFLLQRSKRLHSVLSLQLHINPTDKESISPSTFTYPGASGTVPVREVTQVMKDALNAIVQTLCTSRAIFHAQPDVPSLLLRVLESTQPESDENNLPANLRVSTPTILGLLTSSASFQLLPQDVRSYRPYVDLDTCSASLTQNVFFQKLQEWFRDSCERWETSSSKWLSGLNGVKEVWILRTSIKRLITTSYLREEEKGYLSSNMDTLCHDQIVDIWKKRLSHAKDEFKLWLRSQVLEDAGTNQTGHSISDFLFTPTPIPPFSQNRSSADTAFQKYQLALKRQLVGRSPQLDSVSSVLEECARTIQHDFLIIKGFEEENIRSYVEKLEQTYQPTANDLSCKVADIVEELTTDLIKPPDSNSHGLVFLSRVVDNLVSSSSFIHRIRCSGEAIKDFKERMTSIGNKVLKEWRNVVVKRIVDQTKYQPSSQIFRANGPSHSLLHSLLALAEGVRSLGIVYHPVRHRAVVEDVFRLFFSSLLDGNLDKMDETTLHDLAFLQVLSGLYGPSWSDISFQIHQRLKSVPSDKLNDVVSLASDHLVRSQTLLSILLPSPTIPNFDAPLLQFGIPSAGQNYTSTADLAKPSSRFGMLLVGKTET